MPQSIEQIRARLAGLLADIDAPLAGVTVVPAGANLQAYLASAPSDATLALPPGLVYSGELRIPKPVTLLTVGAFPAERIVSAEGLATIKGRIVVDAPDVTLLNLALIGTTKSATILTTGLRTRVDRCVVRGSDMGQHRGIAANSANVSVTRSRIDGIVSDQDTQAIAGWMGTKSLVVNDCYLEATGENVLFGGADAPTADQMPTDIVVTNCDIAKPLAWRGRPGITCKNLIEVKTGRQITFAHNRCAYSWLNGQVGFAVLVTVRNQDGTAPFSTVEDVLFEGNTFTHCGAGVQILGRDDSPGKPSQRLTNLTFRLNNWSDIDPQAWGGAVVGLDAGKPAIGRLIQISGGPKGVTFDGEAFLGTNLNSAFTFDNADLPTEGLVVTNSRFSEGTYGLKGTGTAMGVPTLERFAPGYVWRGNTMVRSVPTNQAIPYPAGTTIISV